MIPPDFNNIIIFFGENHYLNFTLKKSNFVRNTIFDFINYLNESNIPNKEYISPLEIKFIGLMFPIYKSIVYRVLARYYYRKGRESLAAKYLEKARKNSIKNNEQFELLEICRLQDYWGTGSYDAVSERTKEQYAVCAGEIS